MINNWIDTLARELGREEHNDGGAARRSRRRVLTNVIGSIVAASPLVVANALPVAAAKCKNNKDCGANKRCRNGKCEADQCKNDNDCGANKRCRNGDCEANPNNGGGGNGWEKAGRLSRDEGVEEWKVDRQAGGFKVDFRGSSARQSGVMNLNTGGSGKTFSFVIEQGVARYQLAASDPTFSGTDDRGDSFVARWNRDRSRWDTDQRSAQVAERSRDVFRIGLAIIQDLDPPGSGRGAPITDEAEFAATAQGTCPNSCCQDSNPSQLLEGETSVWDLPMKTRSIACDEARKKLIRQCTDYAVTCDGCCRELGSCDCGCEPFFGSDSLCGCSMYGYPYAPYCRAA